MHAEPHRKIDHSRDSEFPLLPKLICTSLGVGYLPVAPGTWGAILAIILWLPLYIWADTTVCILVTAIATVVLAIAGTWTSNVSEKYWGPDPVIACVDETVGQWFSLIPVIMCPWWEILLSLALFRFFDIFKPLGIRKMEKLPGGVGMMADDLLAGFYSAVILFALNYFIIWT
ncbi:MAG: phosphatidylglycerophosphatase A [Bacteroides sp.]|nr:phosphatidylglycerophosphatase A [Bacteroides sp.]MCM1379297.1 phosphatidylglycerophosphatase A [Bacteroides sp.]MCM1445044.1 phosphatidylglycerophosphatase A [Prevotella sp.]